MALRVHHTSLKSEEVDFDERDSYQGHLTFLRFVLDEQKRHVETSGELCRLLSAIQRAVKGISSAVSRFCLDRYINKNVSEAAKVESLEKFAHELFVDVLETSHAVSMISSCATEELIHIDESKRGNYVVILTPLDGMTEFEGNCTAGSIFSIFKKSENKVPEKEILQQGNKIVSAGYSLYCANTQLIIGLGKGSGLAQFILDHDIGEFIMISRNVKIPEPGSYYSVNERQSDTFDPAVKEFIKKKKESKLKRYSAAYSSCLVADIHRILEKGGIYLYPTRKDAPLGKLNLQYKCNPMSFIVAEAGGMASNGKTPILDIVPNKINQTTPIYIGSRSEVKELVEMIYGYGKYKK